MWCESEYRLVVYASTYMAHMMMLQLTHETWIIRYTFVGAACAVCRVILFSFFFLKLNMFMSNAVYSEHIFSRCEMWLRLIEIYISTIQCSNQGMHKFVIFSVVYFFFFFFCFEHFDDDNNQHAHCTHIFRTEILFYLQSSDPLRQL